MKNCGQLLLERSKMFILAHELMNTVAWKPPFLMSTVVLHGMDLGKEPSEVVCQGGGVVA